MRLGIHGLGVGLLVVWLSAGSAVAQARPDRGFVAAHAALGLDAGVSAGGALGAEVQVPLGGRVSATLMGGRWWFAVGCDLLPGGRCDESAWFLSGGAAVRLTPAEWRWTLAVAARVGRRYYAADRGVWEPSLSLEATGPRSGRVGWLVGFGYHALTDNRPATEPYAPRTNDQRVFRAGLLIRP